MPKVTFRKVGIALQLLIYVCNAVVWISSVIGMTTGFVVGISSDTIRMTQLSDLGFETPATLLVMYGGLSLVVTTVGCFSSITASVILCILYILLIAFYIFFDFATGYKMMFVAEPFSEFYKNLNTSMSKYQDASYGFGFISSTAHDYWDHLQRRGQCCGYDSYEDWEMTPYGQKTANIPDSCCNEEYDYRACGELFFRHPDKGVECHKAMDLIHKKGCLELFPESLRVPVDPRLEIMSKLVGVLFIITFLLSVVIIMLICCKKFRPEEGLNNMEYVEESRKTRHHATTETSEPQPQSKKMSGKKNEGPPDVITKGKIKVHPESNNNPDNNEEPRRNSKRRSSEKDKVMFREEGPQIIHIHHEDERRGSHSRRGSLPKDSNKNDDNNDAV